MIVFGTQPSAEGTTMTTTVEAVSGSTQKIHHRGIVALGVAAILAVGGVSAGIAVAANNDSSPATKPAQIVQTPGVHAHPDPLATRYGTHQSVPFGEQPTLRVGGAR
jgi:hypothetical protein